MNCAKCNHPLKYHLSAADLAPAETAAERLQLIGLTCAECEECFANRPASRCGECGAANPSLWWFARVPVSRCCESPIVDRDGVEVGGGDIYGGPTF